MNNMKKDRRAELAKLKANLEIVLKNSGEKMVAFTTDSAKYDVNAFVNELAGEFVAKKVLIASYDTDITHVDGVEYALLDNATLAPEVLADMVEGYDVVLIICPNMLENKSYLELAKSGVKSVVFVAKKWSSKTANLKNMKALAENESMRVLDMVYVEA